jgi:hypothetical protein
VKTLHIAPGDSAGGSLRHAVRQVSPDDEVLSFLDDLSCGPIASGHPAERAEWWGRYYNDRDIEARLAAFWDRISAADEQLVIWFSRFCAKELAFSLAFADRVGDRPYAYIDVTGRQFPSTRQDGSTVLGWPVQSVGMMNPDMLGSLLGSAQPASSDFKHEGGRAWRQLRGENAPFRVVTAEGMVSAPVDHFDPLLLARATTELRSVARIVGDVMGYNSEPYIQVGNVMLQARVAALVENGMLIADGDPLNLQSCRVRLPDVSSR